VKELAFWKALLARRGAFARAGSTGMPALQAALLVPVWAV
jgi:hypothetical protein